MMISLKSIPEAPAVRMQRKEEIPYEAILTMTPRFTHTGYDDNVWIDVEGKLLKQWTIFCQHCDEPLKRLQIPSQKLKN
jgi:hypothetical protein